MVMGLQLFERFHAPVPLSATPSCSHGSLRPEDVSDRSPRVLPMSRSVMRDNREEAHEIAISIGRGAP
jgi:hypothetical protein